jgi:hypothetical protein
MRLSIFSRRSSTLAVMPAVMLAVAALLAGCCTPLPKPPPEQPQPGPAAAPVPPSAPPVRPAEAGPAEPGALVTRPGGVFVRPAPGPVEIVLAYADRIRPFSAPELGSEFTRLGQLVETPTTQMQAALVLAQTRNPVDLMRAQGLLQKVIINPAAEAQSLQPLARLLSSRLTEQRRGEDDRDRQTQALRDAQRRIDQLNDRIEALRAIERSFLRPAAQPPALPAAPANPPKSAP